MKNHSTKDSVAHLTQTNDLVRRLQELAKEIAGAKGSKDSGAEGDMVTALEGVRRSFAHAIARACSSVPKKASGRARPPNGLESRESPLDWE
jgi:hypothetical protein